MQEEGTLQGQPKSCIALTLGLVNATKTFINLVDNDFSFLFDGKRTRRYRARLIIYEPKLVI